VTVSHRPPRDADRDLLYELFTVDLSPRRHIRVDHSGGHRYMDSDARPPTHVPHAVYLTDTRHRHRLIVLDLDSSRLGAAAVAKDVRRLRQWLVDAGIDTLLLLWSNGGRHVLDLVPRALRQAWSVGSRWRCGVFCARSTICSAQREDGAVRPPAHCNRRGGFSRLDPRCTAPAAR